MSKTTFLCATLALAAACGGSAADEFAAATPDVRGQSIEITASPSEGSAFLADANGVSAQDLSIPPEFLAKARATVKGLNDLVKKFLTPVADAIAAGGKDLANGNAKEFGPRDENGITWKLTVRRIAARRFGWHLEGKPAGQPDTAYAIVAAGRLRRLGSAEHRGSGDTAIDLDAYATIDPASHAQGKLFNAFKHFGADGEAKAVVYALKGFTADSTVAAPADGVVYGHKTASGQTVVRIAALSETLAPLTAGTADAGPELMLARLRWLPAVGGRADVYFPASSGAGSTTNGDVPVGKYIAAKSCWDKSEAEGFKVVAVCNAGQPVSQANCTFPINEGVATACRPGVDRDEAMTDSDRGNQSVESDAPGTLDDTPASSLSESEQD